MGRTLLYEGRGRVFVGAIKKIKHVLMGHEIFLKIFDVPQNIFLCSPLVILIFKLTESELKISTLSINEI